MNHVRATIRASIDFRRGENDVSSVSLCALFSNLETNVISVVGHCNIIHLQWFRMADDTASKSGHGTSNTHDGAFICL